LIKHAVIEQAGAFARRCDRISENRKIAAILVADVVGYSRLAGLDEDRTLSRLRGLRSDLVDPAIAAHHGRVVKRTGDGVLIEFRSVVDAVCCAIEMQDGLIERNAGVPLGRRIEFRVGIHLGDVVEEVDGDLMGDGVNIAARLEGVAKPGAICLSEDAYRQVKQRLDLKVCDLGLTRLKNIAEPVRVYLLEVGRPAGIPAKTEPSGQTNRTTLASLLAGITLLLTVVSGGGWYSLAANRVATDATNVAVPAEPDKLPHIVAKELDVRHSNAGSTQDGLGVCVQRSLSMSNPARVSRLTSSRRTCPMHSNCKTRGGVTQQHAGQ
jgi:class 3 adenylate cyclase